MIESELSPLSVTHGGTKYLVTSTLLLSGPETSSLPNVTESLPENGPPTLQYTVTIRPLPSPPTGLSVNITKPTSSTGTSVLSSGSRGSNEAIPGLSFHSTAQAVTKSSSFFSAPEAISVGGVASSGDRNFPAKPELTILFTPAVTTFPGYAVVSPPSQGASQIDKRPYTNVTSGTIPVWTPQMLGNAYGGGFIITPSVFVTKIPFSSLFEEGIPPGYGSNIIETSLVPGVPQTTTPNVGLGPGQGSLTRPAITVIATPVQEGFNGPATTPLTYQIQSNIIPTPVGPFFNLSTSEVFGKPEVSILVNGITIAFSTGQNPNTQVVSKLSTQYTTNTDISVETPGASGASIAYTSSQGARKSTQSVPIVPPRESIPIPGGSGSNVPVLLTSLDVAGTGTATRSEITVVTGNGVVLSTAMSEIPFATPLSEKEESVPVIGSRPSNSPSPVSAGNVAIQPGDFTPTVGVSTTPTNILKPAPPSRNELDAYGTGTQTQDNPVASPVENIEYGPAEQPEGLALNGRVSTSSTKTSASALPFKNEVYALTAETPTQNSSTASPARKVESESAEQLASSSSGQLTSSPNSVNPSAGDSQAKNGLRGGSLSTITPRPSWTGSTNAQPTVQTFTELNMSGGGLFVPVPTSEYGGVATTYSITAGMSGGPSLLVPVTTGSDSAITNDAQQTPASGPSTLNVSIPEAFKEDTQLGRATNTAKIPGQKLRYESAAVQASTATQSLDANGQSQSSSNHDSSTLSPTSNPSSNAQSASLSIMTGIDAAGNSSISLFLNPTALPRFTSSANPVTISISLWFVVLLLAVVCL